MAECRGGLYAGIFKEFDRVVHNSSGRVVVLSSAEQDMNHGAMREHSKTILGLFFEIIWQGHKRFEIQKWPRE